MWNIHGRSSYDLINSLAIFNFEGNLKLVADTCPMSPVDPSMSLSYHIVLWLN